MMNLVRTVFTMVWMLATSVVGYSQAHAIGHVFAEVVECVSVSAGSNMQSLATVTRSQPSFSAGDYKVSGSDYMITKIFTQDLSLEACDGSMVNFHPIDSSASSQRDDHIILSGSIDASAFDKEMRIYVLRYQMILAYN